MSLSLTYARKLAPFAVLWGSLAAVGCPDDAGPEDIARLLDSMCTQVADCGCSIEAHDEAGCQGLRGPVWNARVEAGRDRGLLYNAGCVAQIEAAVADQNCARADAGDAHLCAEYCAVYHGDKAAGDACDRFDDLVSDCAQGLVCRDGACREPCQVLTGLGEGETCSNEMGGIFEQCARGFNCAFESNTCVRLPDPGEPCLGFECADGAVCNGVTQLCEVPAGAGQSCDATNCDDGSYCEFDGQGGVCRPYAQAGQSCESTQCDEESICDFDTYLCRERPSVGQACISGQCAEELLCDFNTDVCRERPGPGEVCVQNTCGDRLWCDTATIPEGICQVRKDDGEQCMGHGECDSRYCPNGFCSPAPQLGEDCTRVFVCDVGLVCDGVVCRPSISQGPAVCGYPGW